MTAKRSASVANSKSEDDAELDHKKPRTFMATLACEACRLRKTRCDEDKPKCGYCKMNNVTCVYPEPRTTKKDQSMNIAINAIRRLEAKIEDLTTELRSTGKAIPPTLAQSPAFTHPSPITTSPGLNHPVSQPSPATHEPERLNSLALSPSIRDIPLQTSQVQGQAPLSFSQHGVALWPAVRALLPEEFNHSRDALPKDYIVEFESRRAPLPITIRPPFAAYSDRWLTGLPISVVKRLADAYFAVFNRIMPVLDKHHFFSSTVVIALDSEFGYDIETCLLLKVLALGCLAVKAYEEGNFPLPCRSSPPNTPGTPMLGLGFQRPEWYDIIGESPPGLSFFNEARRRFGFLMCENSLQSCQFYMLSTHYYAQILRPIDSWTMVNRAASCCMSLLKRTDWVDWDTWEGDMLARVFWSTLMYETILIQELNLPLSVLQEYENDVPIPKFTSYPRPTTPSATYQHQQDTEEDDAFFNFHFLAQAAHRILLTRIRHSLYFFSISSSFPPPRIVAEMHHQLETWRANLPPALQFRDAENLDDDPVSPAHVIAKAMLKSRYYVAKFHIMRPLLYKVLHAPSHLLANADFEEVKNGLTAGMYWPATIGLTARMMSAQPIRFGWCSQCFGMVLLGYAVRKSADESVRACLPDGWAGWEQEMRDLVERCGRDCPGLRKDAELLGLLVGV